MAARAISFGRIRVHADPNPCKDFFQSLKQNFQNTQEIGLQDLPTRDDFSWAVKKCSNSVDELADILGLNHNEQRFETSMGRIGPRHVVVRKVLPNYDWLDNGYHTTTSIAAPTATPTATSTNSPNTRVANESAAIAYLVVLGIVVVWAVVALLIVLWRKTTLKNRAEKEAQKNRALVPEEAARARRNEEIVRNEWAEAGRRTREREENFELQEIRIEGYGTSEEVVEPEEVYRRPRMDWKK